MADREHLYSCENCSKRIYEGDQVCTFYSEVRFCAEHAVQRSDEIGAWEDALKAGYWDAMLEDNNFANREDVDAHISKLKAVLADTGDGPASLVTV